MERGSERRGGEERRGKERKREKRKGKGKERLEKVVVSWNLLELIFLAHSLPMVVWELQFP